MGKFRDEFLGGSRKVNYKGDGIQTAEIYEKSKLPPIRSEDTYAEHRPW